MGQAERVTQAIDFGRANAKSPKIETLRSIVPFDKFILSGIPYFGPEIGSKVVLATDLAEALIYRLASEHLVLGDPLAKHSTRQAPWVSALDRGQEEPASLASARLESLEQPFGLPRRNFVGFFQGEGLYGGATVYRAKPFETQEAFILTMAFRVIHTELSQRFLQTMNQFLGLTEPELTCLKLFSIGKNLAEVESSTGYTRRAIYAHGQSAARKMGLRDQTHCVAQALRREMFS
ncbi:LuxR family transcriptional regulator [Asticcacaulis sp. DXS10W]|uniref:LuxR family transcriptional regulator n=1 Tax=Asticcacaulis currens TaxID=2984210 RepID=A0ABT5IEJ6_9CAUL|nr:LuxR family transcriptional regulator [Asticcacaulis currens]MDC7694363.1 LuxR family transcriptional regulator [Asticcacaulis currens]